MTNDYPVKGQAGRHGIPMYVCVCMREGFYMLSRGPSLQAFSAREPPCSLCSPVAAEEEEEEEEKRGV